ncbi:hypothetical protein EOD39_19940 [Acipenser ruthenus]|uniref:FAM65 N-terminal domain-containing protein n=1 Tax=Acipenser ruthenus TaxID=7906 RepID=A0A444UWQ9_ACIRT|nr:hypothetical protein EOD39_19940 [Acipenser ruthenus]
MRNKAARNTKAQMVQGFLSRRKLSRFYAVSSSSVRSRVPSVKSMQMYPASNMAGSSPEPQPLQVEKIFRALKKGLK